jgi:outer membrane lipoprotein carrier protein
MQQTVFSGFKYHQPVKRKIMKRYLSIFVLSGVFLFTSFSQGTAWCAEVDLKVVVSALEQGYKELHDVKADFTQRTTLASIKKEQLGSGVLYIKKKPGAAAMFRFDYVKPPQQIVCNGKSVWFYLPENGQVMVSDVSGLFQGQGGANLNYLTGLDHVSRDYNVAFAGNGRDKRGNYVLDLTPKKKNRVLSKIQLTVASDAVEKYTREGKAAEPFPVESSIVYDPYGNKTAINFSMVKVNRGIIDSLFNFKIPKGVEVIKR